MNYNINIQLLISGFYMGISSGDQRFILGSIDAPQAKAHINYYYIHRPKVLNHIRSVAYRIMKDNIQNEIDTQIIFDESTIEENGNGIGDVQTERAQEDTDSKDSN